MPRLSPFAITLALAATAASAQPPSPPSGYHKVTVPTSAGPGEGRETRVLLETPHLKLATILLRRGTVLEAHSAPMPVTIQVISGQGVVELGDRSEPVTAGSLVALAPGMQHLVRPGAGTDMVLLVHHLKTPNPPRRRSGGG